MRSVWLDLRNCLMTGMVLGTAHSALAAAEGEPTSKLASALGWILPWVVAITLLVFVVFRVQRRQSAIIDRSMKHMDQVEQQPGRIIEPLERIADK